MNEQKNGIGTRMLNKCELSKLPPFRCITGTPAAGRLGFLGYVHFSPSSDPLRNPDAGKRKSARRDQVTPRKLTDSLPARQER